MRDTTTSVKERGATGGSHVVEGRYGIPAEGLVETMRRRAAGYFLGEDPTFWVAMVPALVAAALLFTRSLTTNFIFDEQEALLANPYVNGKGVGILEVIHRDFWGLLPERSVGSYRPMPNLVWRAVSAAMRGLHAVAARVTHGTSAYTLYPWVFHWCNVVLHAVNGALLVCFVFRVTKRRELAWLAGSIFVCCAVLTEAVSGVVGLADVLGGLGALLGLLSLSLPLYAMPFGVFGAMLIGLFSKESALVCVPLVPIAALCLSPYLRREKPRALIRFALSGIAATSAFVLYVELRKRWFPSATPAELLVPLPSDAGRLARLLRGFFLWFHQPSLPKDPLNNPFVTADVPHRVAGALRVYWRGLCQLVLPTTLSGDYSFPQEPVPSAVVFPESVLGGLAMVLPPVVAVLLYIQSVVLRRVNAAIAKPNDQAGVTHALCAVSLVWIVLSYFPHSNIPVLLPTVRAERFLYFPAIGSSILLACAFASTHAPRATQLARNTGTLAFAAFLLLQSIKARLHALDYNDDLAFWAATKVAVPRSAKAHLNYSVMWGARGHLDVRLTENTIAADLAPTWPMAHVYLGDTLCRLHRSHEAFPHYVDGFKLADNDPNLIALALQCLWDEGTFKDHERELTDLSEEHPDTWLDFLVKDMSNNGAEFGGVNPKYRPRGYNEGPKE